MNVEQVDRPSHLQDHDYCLPVIYPNIDGDAASVSSGSDDEILSDRENEVPVDQNPETYTIIPGVQVGSQVYVDNLNFKYYKKSSVRNRLKNHNDWPFCPATASINLNNPGYLSLKRLHNHRPGNLSSSVRLVYNQEIVNHPEAAENYTCLQTEHRVKRQRRCRRPPLPNSLDHLVQILNDPIHEKYSHTIRRPPTRFFRSDWPLIVNGNQVGVVFANMETIERYRAELGTVVVAGIDGTFKTVPKSPPELKKGAFVTFQIVYKSVVLALPHLPAHRGHPDCPQHDINDGFRAIINYVQQFPDVEEQLRTFLVGYVDGYWLTQVGPRILSIFGCEYRTNNYLESFHSTLLTQMSKHPNIWDFIQKLILIENQCFVELHQARQNYTIRDNTSRQERFIKTQSIRQQVQTLNVDGDILMFLKAIKMMDMSKDRLVHFLMTTFNYKSHA